MPTLPETNRCQVVFGPAIPLEEIAMMVEHLEAAGMIVAGIIGMAWLACEWNA
jgi:hypothetical protein